jgi:multidrug efflux system membrane fusion protein
VVEQDFPVYRTAIGTVQAYNTVTMRARVDGELQRVAFKEGQDVKAGDLLAVIDPRPFETALAQAEAAKTKDEAQLANAQRDLQRVVELRDFASKQSVDTQRTLVTQLQATIQADQAAVDNAKVQLSYTTITAPLSGRAGARLVDQGNMVRATEGTGLLVITQLQPIFITFTVPQDWLDEIVAAEARGSVKVDALKRDDVTKIATGVLSLIDNQIDTATGTIRLKATFANEDQRLWPGQFVNLRVQTNFRPKALVVPAQAVQRGAQSPYAYIVKPDQTVEARPVKLGPSEAGLTVIESGLRLGETVVIDGQFKLRPGARVDVVGPTDKAKTASNP